MAKNRRHWSRAAILATLNARAHTYSRGVPVITNGPVSTHWSVLSAFSSRSRI